MKHTTDPLRHYPGPQIDRALAAINHDLDSIGLLDHESARRLMTAVLEDEPITICPCPVCGCAEPESIIHHNANRLHYDRCGCTFDPSRMVGDRFEEGGHDAE